MNTNDQRQAIARDLDTMVGMWKDMMVALYGNKTAHRNTEDQ